MSTEIKEGDVVIVKSGGAAMTVERLGTFQNKPSAECVWIDASGKRATGWFAVVALQPYDVAG